MSRETFQAFMTKLDDDAAMRRELLERFGSDRGIAEEDVRTFAAEKGYAFDFQPTDELSDEELESAAGGFVYGKVTWTFSSFHKIDQSYFLKFDTSNLKVDVPNVK